MLNEIKRTAVAASLLFFVISQASSAEDLVKQSQNPLGTINSMPFENNFNTGNGPSESTAYALNMKPVYPVKVGKWNMIDRFILPALPSFQPGMT